ncbi:MgtC/SapB family protein [Paraburkholderia sp.]|uniref:MgtC/SapB family protein n=1 Tax=Paraburkholderia sp. TaxID=1926495 RepID=UPI0023895542|nr:MgtC/SapB family protein [Paraburkholderia sp.]MDE1181167.1 MgtC/SapB family protein [Paraburkholderia sp.]
MLSTTVFQEALIRMLTAMVVGCIVGIDRNLRGKPTGVKTLGLVALGACLVTMAAQGFALNGISAGQDGSRAIQGIVTGVGFLGAGVIVQNGAEEKIRGLTTAASIWVTAALGIVCGVGAWSIALTATVLLMMLLIFGRRAERALHRRWMAKPKAHRDAIADGED